MSICLTKGFPARNFIGRIAGLLILLGMMSTASAQTIKLANLATEGSGWMNAMDQEGQHRLLDPADFVRIEIESALERNIPVIPLLVDGVKMPPAEDLPESIRGLAFRNGISVRPAPDFSVDMARLVKYLRRHFGSTEAEDPGTAVKSEPRLQRRATDQPPPAPSEWRWALLPQQPRPSPRHR